MQISIETWIKGGKKQLHLIGWDSSTFGASDWVAFNVDAINRYLKKVGLSIQDVYWLINIEGDEVLQQYASAKEMVDSIEQLAQDGYVYWGTWR